MSWETEKLRRTLLIARLPGGHNGRDRFAIHPMSRVTTDDGTTYMEPLPMEFLTSSADILQFDKVEFIDPASGAVTADMGDIALNFMSSESSARSSAA